MHPVVAGGSTEVVEQNTLFSLKIMRDMNAASIDIVYSLCKKKYLLHLALAWTRLPWTTARRRRKENSPSRATVGAMDKIMLMQILLLAVGRRSKGTKAVDSLCAPFDVTILFPSYSR